MALPTGITKLRTVRGSMFPDPRRGRPQIGDRFCSECDVVLDLHPDPEAKDPGERGCEIASRKADLLSAWGGR